MEEAKWVQYRYVTYGMVYGCVIGYGRYSKRKQMNSETLRNP